MEITSQNNTAVNEYAIEFAFSAEEFEAAVNSVYNKNKGRITVPGFRKGKAPRKIIEKQYGDNVFYEEAVNSLYNDRIVELTEKSGLDVVDVKDTEVVEISRENGVSFKAVLVTKPVPEISDYKGLEVKKVTKTIDDAAVDAEIEKVRSRNARSITVEDRPAQMGDTAVIDFEGFMDGVAFEGGKGEKFPLELGSHSFIPGFEEQVAGKSIGEEFDVNVTFPENYQAENLKGKDSVFKCRLHEIKAKELPELDDDFVKDVSEFDTMEEYRADIKARLEKTAEEDASSDLDNNIADALIAKMTVEVPEVMYERRINEIAREWSTRNRISVEDYLKYTGTTMEQFRGSFKEIAKKQVDLRLALEKVADLENVEVSDEDVEKEYNEMAEQYKMELDKVKSALPENVVRGDLRIEKALEIVRDSAKIEEVTE